MAERAGLSRNRRGRVGREAELDPLDIQLGREKVEVGIRKQKESDTI